MPERRDREPMRGGLPGDTPEPPGLDRCVPGEREDPAGAPLGSFPVDNPLRFPEAGHDRDVATASDHYEHAPVRGPA